MLKIIHSLKELDFGQLMQVYEQTNRISGGKYHSRLSHSEQLLQAEQDFYNYLRHFFKEKPSIYAVWAPDGRYRAALRLEPYSDGLLLAALETVPEARNQGNATMLVREVLLYLARQGGTRVYSHVDKRNAASLAVHNSCGFEKIKDYAVFIDGSVSYDAYTLCYQRKNFPLS